MKSVGGGLGFGRGFCSDCDGALMEPKTDVGGSGDVSTSVPAGKLGHPLTPTVVLVVMQPVAIWHLFGDQTNYSDDSPQLYLVWRAPSWLNELPHPIGLICLLTVLAARLWLAWEYWRQSWRKRWFVVGGSLCMMGIYAGLGGRYATAGITEDDFINFYGWLSLLSAPGVFVLFLTMLGVAVYRMSPESTSIWLSKVHFKPTRRLGISAILLGGLISLGISLGVTIERVVRIPDFRFRLNEAIDAAVLFLPLLLVVGVLGLLVYLTLLAAGVIAVWSLLFRSIDWILKRRNCW